jgi:hypothetical protein
MSTFVEAVSDASVVTKRNLIKIKRVPDLVVWTTMMPIMFVLLFAYVFGGAIDVPGVGYREFLIAGIFVQTVVFGATFTGYSVAEDLQKGIIDRFRSLPMAPSAVLFGRTISDVAINVISLAIMSLTGLIVGWRVHTSVLEALAAVDLHRQHVRAEPDAARPARDLRQLEPDLVGHPGRPRAVRQHQRPDAPGGRVADAAPGDLLRHLDRHHPGGVHPGVDAPVHPHLRPHLRRHLPGGRASPVSR